MTASIQRVTPRLDCFVTGTDTGIGKTHASATLIHALRLSGLAAIGMKPVASGAEWQEGPAGEGEWRNDDVAALRAAGNVDVPPALTCPWLLRTPCSPHLAARLESVRIAAAPILAAFGELRSRADAVVVEGVGGFQVPLDADPATRWDTADLADRLALPVVMVVGIRLGCLNHALLTAQAIRARGLTLAGWIANRIDPAMALAEDNVATLREMLGAPCLGELPWQLDPAAAAPLLDLVPLQAAAYMAASRPPAPASTLVRDLPAGHAA